MVSGFGTNLTQYALWVHAGRLPAEGLGREGCKAAPSEIFREQITIVKQTTELKRAPQNYRFF